MERTHVEVADNGGREEVQDGPDVQNSCLLSLPPEIIINILLCLTHNDVQACKLSARYLYDLIKHSPEVQYQTALCSFGAEDNPHSALSISEKLQSIRATERAWSLVEPDFVASVSVPRNMAQWYDIMDGMFWWSDAESGAVHYLALPDNEDDEAVWKTFQKENYIVSFAVAVYEHDLIAIVSSRPTQDEDGNVKYALELHLYQFSTRKEHPKAREPHSLLMYTFNDDPMSFQQVVGKYLTFSCLTMDRSHVRTIVLDWQTHEIRMDWLEPSEKYLGHRFLTEDLLIFTNKENLSIDIFRIPPQPILTQPTPILALQLPRVAPGLFVESFHLCVKPNPRQESSQQPGEDPAFAPSRSYLATHEDAIFVFRLQVDNCFTFIIHRRALIDLVEKSGSDNLSEVSQDVAARSPEAGPLADTNMQTSDSEEGHSNEPATPLPPRSPPTLPYSEWGPDITRWFSSLQYAMVLSTWGQRHVRVTNDDFEGRGSSVIVYDFNPARVEQFKVDAMARESTGERKAEKSQPLEDPISPETGASAADGQVVPEAIPGADVDVEISDVPSGNGLAAADQEQLTPQSPTSEANASESVTAVRTWCVSSVDRVEPKEIFLEPVLGGLPYVASSSKARYPFGSVIMDESRIIGLKKSWWGFTNGLEILHIG